MVSRAYFQSTDCVEELKRAMQLKKPIIPLILEPVELISHLVDGYQSEIKVSPASLSPCDGFLIVIDFMCGLCRNCCPKTAYRLQKKGCFRETRLKILCDTRAIWPKPSRKGT